MLGRRLRRRPNIKATLGQCLVFAGDPIGPSLVSTTRPVLTRARPTGMSSLSEYFSSLIFQSQAAARRARAGQVRDSRIRRTGWWLSISELPGQRIQQRADDIQTNSYDENDDGVKM